MPWDPCTARGGSLTLAGATGRSQRLLWRRLLSHSVPVRNGVWGAPHHPVSCGRRKGWRRRPTLECAGTDPSAHIRICQTSVTHCLPGSAGAPGPEAGCAFPESRHQVSPSCALPPTLSSEGSLLPVLPPHFVIYWGCGIRNPSSFLRPVFEIFVT